MLWGEDLKIYDVFILLWVLNKMYSNDISKTINENLGNEERRFEKIRALINNFIIFE